MATVVDSIDSLLKATTEAGILGRVRFRGQADVSWPLLPSIGGRNHYRHGACTLAEFTTDDERILLHRFRRQACEFVGTLLNDWDTLFLARHHGLPVRLLDWSSNPLVALYHAAYMSPASHRMARFG